MTKSYLIVQRIEAAGTAGDEVQDKTTLEHKVRGFLARWGLNLNYKDAASDLYNRDRHNAGNIFTLSPARTRDGPDTETRSGASGGKVSIGKSTVMAQRKQGSFETLVPKHRKNCECCPGHYLSTSVY